MQCEHKFVSQVIVSPFPGGRPDWPQCAYCDAAPVVLSARREGGFGSALFCADCAPKVGEGDPQVVARVPDR
jgi:hypothetical protein